MPEYKLKLYRTYYRNGFFNIPVSYDRYVRSDNGPINLFIPSTGQTIPGIVNRDANNNHTARVMGGVNLRDYFQRYHEEGDIIRVEFVDMKKIQIG
jgi:hypothetical protein